MELRRRSIVRGDVELSYLDSGGDGGVVVFLHGLAGSAGEFVASAEALVPGHRAVLVDQRGHGHSTRMPADVSREAFVADAVAIVEAVAAPGERVRLVGQSMGAHTALLVAASRPDLVAQLILLENAFAVADEETNRSGAELGDFFRSWPVPFADAEAARAFLGETPLAGAWLRDLEATASGLAPRFDAAVMQSVAETLGRPRWDEWRSIRIPVTAVFARDGMFSEQQKAEFISARPQTRRVDLRGGSHDAHLDAEDEWLELLRASLGPQPSQRRAARHDGGPAGRPS